MAIIALQFLPVFIQIMIAACINQLPQYSLAIVDSSAGKKMKLLFSEIEMCIAH